MRWIEARNDRNRSVIVDLPRIPVLGPGSIHVSTSTISAGLSRRLTEQHRAHNQGYVALPVPGNPDPAHHRDIYLLAGGAPGDIDRVRKVVEELGRKLFVIGEEPALANVMKLRGNVLTAATLQSMGEVIALLGKCGINPQTAFEVLTGSSVRRQSTKELWRSDRARQI